MHARIMAGSETS